MGIGFFFSIFQFVLPYLEYMVIIKNCHIKIWLLGYGNILVIFREYGNRLYGDIFGNLENMVIYYIAWLVREKKRTYIKILG